MRVLITGAQGFIGSYLAKYLASNGLEIFSEHFDVTDQRSTRSMLKQVGTPDVVIHLAGISHVRACDDNPAEAFRANVFGTHTVLSELISSGFQTQFILASTAQVYAPSDEALTEDSSLRPQNYYAQTKLMAEQIAQKYCERSSKVRVTCLRLFNHTHKSQSPDFFLPSVYRQISDAKAKGARRATITAGNVEVLRDIGAIQDLASAFHKICRRPLNDMAPFEIFNLCSGQTKRLKTLIELMGKAFEIGIDISVREDLIRKIDPKVICGSSLKLQNAVNWAPECARSEKDLIAAFLRD